MLSWRMQTLQNFQYKKDYDNGLSYKWRNQRQHFGHLNLSTTKSLYVIPSISTVLQIASSIHLNRLSEKD